MKNTEVFHKGCEKGSHQGVVIKECDKGHVHKFISGIQNSVLYSKNILVNVI